MLMPVEHKLPVRLEPKDAHTPAPCDDNCCCIVWSLSNALSAARDFSCRSRSGACSSCTKLRGKLPLNRCTTIVVSTYNENQGVKNKNIENQEPKCVPSQVSTDKQANKGFLCAPRSACTAQSRRCATNAKRMLARSIKSIQDKVSDSCAHLARPSATDRALHLICGIKSSHPVQCLCAYLEHVHRHRQGLALDP